MDRIHPAEFIPVVPEWQDSAIDRRTAENKRVTRGRYG